MAGALPDGEGFSTSGAITTGAAASQFMVYDTLRYPFAAVGRDKGSLVGTVTFEQLAGSDFDGTVIWEKPLQTSGKYKAAIETTLTVIGSRYTPPGRASSVLPGLAAGTLALSDTGRLSLSGTAPLIENVTLASGNQLKITKPDMDNLTVRINPSTGVFEGTFLYPGRETLSDFAGVLFQARVVGGGFFLGPAGSGTVDLKPTPP